MEENKKIPGIVQLGAWLLSLSVFAVGFWHTHLGLKEMKPFGSEWGGLIIAGIVLLLMLITYWFAINGKKMALVFYIFCGIIFFACNLNYFYPAYMARTLVSSEAKKLSDTLDYYSNTTKGLLVPEVIEEYNKLESIKTGLLDEIKRQEGWGPRSTDFLNQWKTIFKGSTLKPDLTRGSSQEDRDIKFDVWTKKLNQDLEAWIVNNAFKGVKQVTSLVKGMKEMDSLHVKYKPLLDSIVVSSLPFNNLDSIRSHYQVVIIKKFVEAVNSSIDKINRGLSENNKLLNKLQEKDHPRASHLGEIENTFITIGERIEHISTWAILILCLFIDLLAPLAIYLFLRKKEGDDEDSTFAPGPDSF